jgi:hypothetical protein
MNAFAGWDTMTLPELWREVVDIAERYQWDIPGAVDQLKSGVVPEGFCREVGATIALFFEPLPISYVWLGLMTQQQEDAYRQETRAHGLALVRLRVLLARIHLLTRQEV